MLGRDMTSTQQLVPERGVPPESDGRRPISDLERILALLAASDREPLKREELVALCHLISTDPSDEWPILASNYDFNFEPGPSSRRLAADLNLLVDTSHATANSPLKLTDEGKRLLERKTYGEELVKTARRAIRHYRAQPGDLVEQSMERARTLVDLYKPDSPRGEGRS